MTILPTKNVALAAIPVLLAACAITVTPSDNTAAEPTTMNEVVLPARVAVYHTLFAAQTSGSAEETRCIGNGSA